MKAPVLVSAEFLAECALLLASATDTFEHQSAGTVEDEATLSRFRAARDNCRAAAKAPLTDADVKAVFRAVGAVALSDSASTRRALTSMVERLVHP